MMHHDATGGLAVVKPTTQPVVIAVASGKGGVGKTWLSVTLAHALVRRGRRVLLLDCDLGLANVDIQLGLIAERDIGAVLAGSADLDDVVVKHASGLDILSGRSGSGDLAAFGDTHAGVLGAMIGREKHRYDFVILDLGAGLDRFVRTMSASADLLLVVATGEPTSLTDAYAVLKLYRQDRAGRPLRARIVINQATSDSSGAKTHATLVRASTAFLCFSPGLAGIIRRDDKIQDAIRRQTLLLERHPDCGAARDVEAIADRMLDPGIGGTW